MANCNLITIVLAVNDPLVFLLTLPQQLSSLVGQFAFKASWSTPFMRSEFKHIIKARSLTFVAFVIDN
eukprot:scaffold65967_cov98-Cyclotella_meneghiniana.AAC.1